MSVKRGCLLAGMAVCGTQLVLGFACTSSKESKGPRPEPPATDAMAVDQEVQPVSMPDLSRLSEPVAKQVRERFDTLEQAIKRQAPPQELGRAYGEVGVI